MSGYVVKSFEPGLWTVGHYQPDGKFYPEADYTDQAEAGQRCHFLNGGTSAALQQERDRLAGQLADLRGLVTEILGYFWPGPRFEGISEGLQHAQASVDGWRERAGLERQS